MNQQIKLAMRYILLLFMMFSISPSQLYSQASENEDYFMQIQICTEPTSEYCLRGKNGIEGSEEEKKAILGRKLFKKDVLSTEGTLNYTLIEQNISEMIAEYGYKDLELQFVEFEEIEGFEIRCYSYLDKKQRNQEISVVLSKP